MQRYFRRVIKITAADSPNVRYGFAEQRLSREPSGRRFFPGVVTYDEYLRRRATWDENRQAVGLDAEWFEGAEMLLFPFLWLQRAAAHEAVQRCQHSPAEALGVDPGEGGANTAWAVVNRYGLRELVSYKTPDTNVIVDQTLDLARKHNVPTDRVCFDRGSGKQHADRLRARGHSVTTVAFGGVVSLEPKRGLRLLAERRENVEERYTYKNKRAQMYGELSERMDPGLEEDGTPAFAVPDKGDVYEELRRQLGTMPKRYDDEGRLYLPPKGHTDDDEDGTKETLAQLLGRSPDEADALVIAYHTLTHKTTRPRAGAL